MTTMDNGSRPVVIALNSVFDAIMYLADQFPQGEVVQGEPQELGGFVQADKIPNDPLLP